MPMTERSWDFLGETAEEVAPRLLGCTITRQLHGQIMVGKIVETEAYDQDDAASHSYHGRTPRTDVMFGPPGHLYVYFTYGRHYCCNVVTGPVGQGSAVLIRAIEPLQGSQLMEKNRQTAQGVNVTNGPAKLCQALDINKVWNGHDLKKSPIRLGIKPALPKTLITQTTRIGIRQATEKLWRFYVTDSPYVSFRSNNS